MLTSSTTDSNQDLMFLGLNSSMVPRISRFPSPRAMKNAMIPVVTFVGLFLPVLIGGTVIIEQIFALPGMGRLVLEAISRRDYGIVSGVMFFFAIAIPFASW